jgi:cell division protein ZapA
VKTIRVEIYDQSYNLRGDLDERYVAQIAREVDQRMRSVAASTRTVDTVRIAVLAALNIADELLSTRQRLAEVEGTIRERAERCLSLVDQALQKSA